MKSLLRTVFVTSALLVLALTAQAKTGWIDDYQKALSEAKTNNKLVLLDFTGSDWCPWCIKMDKEVFDKPAFKDYAKGSLVLMDVDFPTAKRLSAKVKKQNEGLKEQFKVSGFPTLVVVDGDGKLVKSYVGYQQGGPEAFVGELEKLKK
jgi:thioredoxin-related protein